MTDSTSSGKSVSRSNASNQIQIPRIRPMIRYATNVWPTLIPTSLPGRPSKIPPVTVVVMRKPNQARKPTTSPPPAPPGRPTLANRPYSRKIARISDAMKLPMSPPATPFGACFRIASMSASVLPRTAIHTFPNTGRDYQIPPMIKLRIAATTTAISKLVSKSAIRTPPPTADPVTALIVFLACDSVGAQKRTFVRLQAPPILRRTGRVRDRAWRRRGSRGRSRSNRLGRCFRFRRPEEVPDHGRVRIDEAARKPLLAEPEDVRLLQAPADVDLEVEPLESREERRVRSEFGSEAAQVHHADRRETNPEQRLRDTGEVDLGLAGLAPDHVPVPIEAREDVG